MGYEPDLHATRYGSYQFDLFSIWSVSETWSVTIVGSKVSSIDSLLAFFSVFFAISCHSEVKNGSSFLYNFFCKYIAKFVVKLEANPCSTCPKNHLKIHVHEINYSVVIKIALFSHIVAHCNIILTFFLQERSTRRNDNFDNWTWWPFRHFCHQNSERSVTSTWNHFSVFPRNFRN